MASDITEIHMVIQLKGKEHRIISKVGFKERRFYDDNEILDMHGDYLLQEAKGVIGDELSKLDKRKA